MDTQKYNSLACEYELTAKKLKERVAELKKERASTPFDIKKRLEERIAILEAEYGHLLKVATYMRLNYADEQSEGDNKCETQSA